MGQRHQHQQTRGFLRAIGPLVFVVGLVFTAIGLISFFSAFGSFGGPPQHFWCAFVGLPLMAVGSVISKFAYMGAITRYVANEVTPVGTDVFNTVVSETQESFRDLARTIGTGLRDGRSAGRTPSTGSPCGSCGTANAPEARYCKECGVSLASRRCEHCGDTAPPDARFCDSCGEPLPRRRSASDSPDD